MAVSGTWKSSSTKPMAAPKRSYGPRKGTMRLRSRDVNCGGCVAVLFLIAGPVNGLAQADVSSWPQVRVQLIALDSNGGSSVAVTKDSLELREDGRVQPIDQVSVATEPQSVCILIDSSGSMYSREDAVRY